ncbi:MAG TPA: epoxide hydrolase N-terminal domain-containing protein [Solirubrobacterales bacterium]|nr:epoxide hydrolase N-terminal domain-containing protein [Solirubrobacterales bacterium]
MRPTAIEPFRVSVSEAELEDLRARLAATRWPRPEPKLNALPQFRTEIDGLGIYFIHVRSPHEEALPLVLTHGWPGSVFEFLDSVGPLTDPTAHGGEEEDAFHLVIPALPGYGFSDPPAETGWGADRISIGSQCKALRRSTSSTESVALK